MPGNFIANDLNTFIETTDFGSACIFTPQPSGSAIQFNGIFDDVSQVFDSNQGKFVDSAPQVQCKASDISGIKLNDVITVAGNSATYHVMKTIPDGTGMAIVYLSKGSISK